MKPTEQQKKEFLERREAAQQESLSKLFKEQNPETKVTKATKYVEVKTEKIVEKEKIVTKELPRPFTQQDITNINIIFDYAKRYTMDNDENLIEVLLVKKGFVNKLKQVTQ